MEIKENKALGGGGQGEERLKGQLLFREVGWWQCSEGRGHGGLRCRGLQDFGGSRCPSGLQGKGPWQPAEQQGLPSCRHWVFLWWLGFGEVWGG